VEGGGEAIYYGFAKLKGLGEDVSTKIVAQQPYQSFEDFLQKFGTEAKVLTALISLGVFGSDRVSYFKFYERYKDWVKKVADRDKRHHDSKERHHQKLFEALKAMFPAGTKFPVGFSDDHFAKYGECFDDGQMKSLNKLRTAYFKCIETYAKKKEMDQLPRFADFFPGDFDIDEKWGVLLSQPIEEAEMAYYGFRWTHPLELSPDYREHDRKTFHLHRQAVEEGSRSNYVEVEIHKVQEKPTKKGGVYYLLHVSDVMGEENRINVWEDDYKVFGELLVEGNLVKMMLDAPDSGFPTYKLHSPPRHLRYKLPHQSMDFRVIKYRRSGEDY
jgi:DNA polymerase III alpha subunit